MSSAGAYASMLINEYGVDPQDIGTLYNIDSLDVVLHAFAHKGCSDCGVSYYGEVIECNDCYDEEQFYLDGIDDKDDGLTDAEADAMTLASAGWGTDEDYGFYGEDSSYE